MAMLLRWHIYRPAHLFRTHTPASPNHLQNILTTVIAAHPTATQARKNALLQQLSTVGGPLTNSVTVKRRGSMLVLSYRLGGADGRAYRLIRQDRTKPPQFTITQGDKQLASGAFEFG